MITNIADLRFAFKSGAVSLVEAVKNGEEPPVGELDQWLEEKFQDFFKLYTQLSMAMAGMGFDDDLVAALLPKA